MLAGLHEQMIHHSVNSHIFLVLNTVNATIQMPDNRTLTSNINLTLTIDHATSQSMVSTLSKPERLIELILYGDQPQEPTDLITYAFPRNDLSTNLTFEPVNLTAPMTIRRAPRSDWQFTNLILNRNPDEVTAAKRSIWSRVTQAIAS